MGRTRSVRVAAASSQQQQQPRAIQFRPCIDIHKVRANGVTSCVHAMAAAPTAAHACALLPLLLRTAAAAANLNLPPLPPPQQRQGKVKQIVGSTLKDLPADGQQQQQQQAAASTSGSSADEPRTNFVSDKPSSWFADLYKKDALTGGHVIMLGADDASVAAAKGALAAWPGGLQLGGGVTADNAAQWLDAGASHVIVTSYVFREGRLEEGRLADLVAKVGRRRLVLDLSCRKKDDGRYYVVTDRWQRFSSLALSEAALARLAESCDEFLVHGVDVEGMQLGIDDELVALLGRWSPIPVTYAGGARTLVRAR